MRRHALALLILVAGFAGCATVPFGGSSVQEQPVPVRLENRANQTQTFEVSLIKVGEHITIRRNGITQNITVSEGSYTFKSSEVPIEEVTLPESAHVLNQYTLEPGQIENITVEELPRNSAVYISIYDEKDGAFRAIKSVNCGGGNLLGYRVVTEAGPDDVRSAFQCA